MNRRGFMELFGIGAVAGPAVVKQHTDNLVSGSATGIGYSEITNAAIPWNPVEQLAAARKEYDALTKDPAAWIAEHAHNDYTEYLNGYTSYHYGMIDPDIRNMKSFSESTKIRMFFERKARRKQQHYINSILSKIQILMKEV